MLSYVLREWRTHLKLTQKQAAGTLGISLRSYTAMERGEREIRRPVMLACLYLEANPRLIVRGLSG